MPRLFLLLSVALTAGCASWSGGGGGDEVAEMEAAATRPPLPGGDKARRGEFPAVPFADTSWALSPEAQQSVKEMAKALRQRLETVVLTGGASVSPPEYARQLGQLRAAEVRRLLLAHGIPEARVVAAGYGQDLSGRGDLDRVEVSLAPAPAVAARP